MYRLGDTSGFFYPGGSAQIPSTHVDTYLAKSSSESWMTGAVSGAVGRSDTDPGRSTPALDACELVKGLAQQTRVSRRTDAARVLGVSEDAPSDTYTCTGYDWYI